MLPGALKELPGGSGGGENVLIGDGLNRSGWGVAAGESKASFNNSEKVFGSSLFSRVILGCFGGENVVFEVPKRGVVSTLIDLFAAEYI